MFNVNVPNVESGRIEEAEITRLGPMAYLEGVEEGHDGRRTHYWIRSRPTGKYAGEGTDIWAVRNNLISITASDPGSISGEGRQELSLFVRELPDMLATCPLTGRLRDRQAVDIGGTFTDVGIRDTLSGASWTAKTPSAPDDLAREPVRGVQAAMGIAGTQRLPDPPYLPRHDDRHQCRYRACRWVTTRGFKYVLEIGRHDIPQRQNIYV